MIGVYDHQSFDKKYKCYHTEGTDNIVFRHIVPASVDDKNAAIPKALNIKGVWQILKWVYLIFSMVCY